MRLSMADHSAECKRGALTMIRVELARTHRECYYYGAVDKARGGARLDREVYDVLARQLWP